MNTLNPRASVPIDPVDAMLLRHFAQICEALDLAPAQWNRAKKAYESLGDMLCDPMNPLARHKPSVYTQGSARLQTAIRPIRGDEFDIDLICELLAMRGHTIDSIFSTLKAAIEANKTYAGRVTLMNRCVRISFPKDFHLDVTPALPDAVRGPTNIQVADRLNQRLKESNPKGYCDDWFTRVAAVPPRIRSAPPRAGTFEAMLDSRADVEPVADPKPMRPVVVRVIQLFKRHRDITCGEDKDAPISAIITTAAAHAYADLCLQEFDNLYDLILAIARALPSKLGPPALVNGRWIHTCPNPANLGENYADKWMHKPGRQDAFFAWQAKLVAYLAELRGARGQGSDFVHRRLAAGFGEDLVRKFTVGDAQNLRQRAASCAVGISAAGLILPRKSAAIEIPRQTFHGGDLPQ